jgi:hypothetical protein
LSFQWYAGDEPIDGETSATLVLADVAYANSNLYVVNISNDFGSVDSEPIAVAVAANITKRCDTQVPAPYCTIEFPNEVGIKFTLQFRDNPSGPWLDTGQMTSNGNGLDETLSFDDFTGDGRDARLYRVLGFPIRTP